MSLRPGDRVERYEVIRDLGEGGMAKVHLVRHTTLDTLHALKILTLTGKTLKERLIEEGRTQAKLRQYPNVVPVTDVLEVEGMPALLMDFVDGPDLHRWIREQRPSAAQAEEVFRGIVAGVQAAHALGLVHRDLKPANVLMGRDAMDRWVPKVGDFGLVKALEGDEVSWKTRSGVPMGTPQYMAPEQIRNAAGVDHRADLFSLGCILYELLAGHPAYSGDDLITIFERVEKGERAPLPEGTPPHLVAVVDALLQRDPAARPPDCAAVLDALEGRLVPSTPPIRLSEGPGVPTPPATLTEGHTAAPRTGPTGRALAPPAGARAAAPLALGVAGSAALVAGLAVLLGGAVGLWWLVGSRDPTAPCPVGGGELGVVKAPPLFTKRAGGTWVARADSPVLEAPPAEGAVGTQVCTLPKGARVTLVEDPADGWIRVRGDALELPADPSAPLPPEEEPAPPAPSAPCAGPAGEVVGWFYTRPLALAGAPAVGRTWSLTTPKDVLKERPAGEAEAGEVVCRLPAGARVRVEQPPVKVGRGFWVPLVGGAVESR